mmetsp:Transcript_9144/g.21357  ORF Transcript_9144/g.21357 Transcript_9144/m.21357 type:complete len:459 (+) Transcript_9144:80-1456(+)
MPLGNASVLSAILGEECDSDLDTYGFIVWVLLVLSCFYLIAKLAAVWLQYAEVAACRLRLSHDLASALLALADTAPALACTLLGFALGAPELGLGGAVGAAFFDSLCVFGVCLTSTKRLVRMWWYPAARDVAFHMVAITALALVLEAEPPQWWQALFLVLTYAAYVLYAAFNERICKQLGLKPPKGLEKAYFGMEWLSVEVEQLEVAEEGPIWPVRPSRPARFHCLARDAEEVVMELVQLASFDASEVGRAFEGFHAEGEASVRGGALEVASALRRTCYVKGQLAAKAPGTLWACLVRWGAAVIALAVALLAMVYALLDGASRLSCVAGVAPAREKRGLSCLGFTVIAAGIRVPRMILSMSDAKCGSPERAAARAVQSSLCIVSLGIGLPWCMTGPRGKAEADPSCLDYLLLLAGAQLLQLFLVLAGELTVRAGGLLLVGYVGSMVYALVCFYQTLGT